MSVQNVGLTMMIVGAVGVVISLWYLCCCARAYSQQRRLLLWMEECCGNYEGWKRLVSFFDLVPFGSHVWRLFFLRDPKYLYHFSLWKGLP